MHVYRHLCILNIQDGKLQNGDKLQIINGVRVETMSHQEVVEKLRLLNEEADFVTLWVTREVSKIETSTMKVQRKPDIGHVSHTY